MQTMQSQHFLKERTPGEQWGGLSGLDTVTPRDLDYGIRLAQWSVRTFQMMRHICHFFPVMYNLDPITVC